MTMPSWSGCGANKRYSKKGMERGAALLEAVISIPFLIIIFVAIMSVAILYLEKMRVTQTARERAWTFAMGACGEQGNARLPSASLPPSTGTLDDGSGGMAGLGMGSDPSMAGAPTAENTKQTFGATTSIVETEVGSDKLLGGYKRRVKASIKVMCNEPPYDGNLIDLLHKANGSIN